MNTAAKTDGKLWSSTGEDHKPAAHSSTQWLEAEIYIAAYPIRPLRVR